MLSRDVNRQGFTLIEVVIAVAIVAILAAAISPMVFHHLEDAKVGKAQNETETIALAVMSYYKDTGTWPYTNQDGPAGNGVERVISSPVVAAGAGPAAGANAVRWGNYGDTKMLGDYLYYNTPDGDSDPAGANENQAAQDWPTAGPNSWRGPYLDSYEVNDPWGHAYVINTYYAPGGGYNGTVRHKVFVLSAGPNGRWETPFNNGVTEDVLGDDVGSVVTID